jgi:hypothetical protein
MGARDPRELRDHGLPKAGVLAQAAQLLADRPGLTGRASIRLDEDTGTG